MYRFGFFLFAGCFGMAAQESSPPPVQLSVDMGPQVAGIAGPVSTGFAIADGGDFAFTMAFPGPPVTGAPYSADTSTEMVQTLADGNRIDHTTAGTIARDSQGRTRVEHTMPTMPNASTSVEPRQLITISDPVSGYTYMLDPVKKVAHRMPAKMGPVTLASQSKLPNKLATAASPDGEFAAPTKTDLGTQTVNGVPAQGTKMIRTIPAGAIGNESPITITTETWYSPSLKVVVMSKSNDPRIGETTYNLTNIARSEPSPDLFEVPSDYTIQDGPAIRAVSARKVQ